MKNDQYFLRKAVEAGNQRQTPFDFGAVIVKDGKIIATETEHVIDDNDPTAHECIYAIRAAQKKLQTFGLEGCTMYCNNEPCLMCFAAAFWARIGRVVYAFPKEEVRMPYELHDGSLQEIAAKFSRRIKVEHIKLNDR